MSGINVVLVSFYLLYFEFLISTVRCRRLPPVHLPLSGFLILAALQLRFRPIRGLSSL